MVFGEIVFIVNCIRIHIHCLRMYTVCCTYVVEKNSLFIYKVYLQEIEFFTGISFFRPFYLQSHEVHAMKHIKNAELQDCMF